MSDGRRDAEGMDCIVVGGGLAGLTCAQGLSAAGRRVLVLEAGDALGGRARTVWHRGRPVDRGFQVLFAAYPRTRRLLKDIGLPRRDLRPIAGGAVFIGADRVPRRLGTSPVAGLRFDGLPPSDRLRLAALGARALGRSVESLLAEDGDAPSTEALLRAEGFTEAAIEGFFRPLFGVILLDRELSADPGYFRFLLAMLVRGPSVIPSDGMGMIAEWTSAAVRRDGGAVELGTEVEALEVDPEGRRVTGVRTGDGRVLRAGHVVLAVAAPAARRLLAGIDDAAVARMPGRAASSATAAFALRYPLYSGRSIVVNADPGPAPGGGPRVDLICQTTNITRPGAPDGPHILLATTVTTGGGSAEGLVEAVGAQARRWAPRYDWDAHAEPIDVYEHDFAQFVPGPGVRRGLPGPRTRVENLILAGDLTTHPSIEGAVSSGARAAEIVGALIP